jgi:hypothetical protein
MRALTSVAVVIAAATMGLWAEERPAEWPVPPAAQRFLDRREAPLVGYRAIRRLSASTDRPNISGWVEASTELDPVRGFLYHVTSEGGSEYIRKHVLRKVLAAEQAAQGTAERTGAALTLDNYVFGEAAEEPSGYLLVPIAPRRRAELLVRGVMVLSLDADLMRVEGRLSKNPSFWTKRVDVVRRYARVNGIRVPVEMSSRAVLRIVGPSRFTMCIDYELLNGQLVDDRTSCS